MKRILIVLVMIAGSVFMANPALAAEGDPATTTDSTVQADAPADPAPVAEEPKEEAAPADPAPEADARAAVEVVVDAPASDPAPDPSTESKTPKSQTSSRTTSSFTTATLDEAVLTWCHATGSESNPYLAPSTGDAGQAHGHIGHTGPTWYQGAKADGISWGDIVPPFTYLGVVYSLNWDVGGQIIFNNNCSPIRVTPTTPTATAPTCLADGALVIPTQTGVIYGHTPSGTGPATYAVTASAAPGYQLVGTKAWSITVLPKLAQSSTCPTSVIPTTPTALPPTCVAPGSLVIPTQTGVVFGHTPAGTGPGSYNITATAANNTWVLSGTTAWDITVLPTLPQSADCPVTITPNAPSANPPTCVAPGSLVIPTQTGVTYGQSPSGTGPGSYHITAIPADASWLLTGTQAWDVTVLPTLPQSADCPVTITATAPSANPPTCEIAGSLTIPTQTGVSYGQSPSGTGPGSYHITAAAASASWVLSGTTSWDVTVLPTLPQSADCPVTITANPPGANAPTCVADGSLFVPSQTGVTYGHLPAGTGPADYVVTATPADASWVLSGTTSWDVTVLPTLPQSADCPVTITATAPSADGPTCDADGSLFIPTQEGVAYEQDPAGSGAGDYHVTAAPADASWVLSGPTEWDITVLPTLPQSADCPVGIAVDGFVITENCDGGEVPAPMSVEGIVYEFTVGDGISGLWEIVASALPGFVLDGQSVFTGDAGDPSNCIITPDGVVVPDSIPVTPAATPLPDTGGLSLGLLPFSGMLIVGGSLLVARRRRV